MHTVHTIMHAGEQEFFAEESQDAWLAQDFILAVADGGASTWFDEGMDTGSYAKTLIKGIKD